MSRLRDGWNKTAIMLSGKISCWQFSKQTYLLIGYLRVFSQNCGWLLVSRPQIDWRQNTERPGSRRWLSQLRCCCCEIFTPLLNNPNFNNQHVNLKEGTNALFQGCAFWRINSQLLAAIMSATMSFVRAQRGWLNGNHSLFFGRLVGHHVGHIVHLPVGHHGHLHVSHHVGALLGLRDADWM